MLAPETILAGRYRVTDVIARGGMGVVYAAEDERLGRPVAIKTVATDEPDLAARLRAEGRVLAQLWHPHIVALFDAFDHGGRPHLVSELVPGPTLRELRGQLPEPAIRAIGAQIAGALAAAHGVGVVHGDLKPSNIIVGDRPRLVDFGIARHLDDTVPTTRDVLVGTMSYVAPEQLHGQAPTAASDVYGLGLVLLEAFSGRAAFPGDVVASISARVLRAPDIPTEIPPRWRSIVVAMVDPDPGRRPSARQVADRLARLTSARTGGAVALPAPAPTAPSPQGPTAGPTPVTVRTIPARTGQRRRPSRHAARSPLAVPVAAALTVLASGAAVRLLGENDGSAAEPLRSTAGERTAQSAPEAVEAGDRTSAAPDLDAQAAGGRVGSVVPVTGTWAASTTTAPTPSTTVVVTTTAPTTSTTALGPAAPTTTSPTTTTTLSSTRPRTTRRTPTTSPPPSTTRPAPPTTATPPAADEEEVGDTDSSAGDEEVAGGDAPAATTLRPSTTTASTTAVA